jgi:hypothetical protein
VTSTRLAVFRGRLLDAEEARAAVVAAVVV